MVSKLWTKTGIDVTVVLEGCNKAMEILLNSGSMNTIDMSFTECVFDEIPCYELSTARLSAAG